MRNLLIVGLLMTLTSINVYGLNGNNCDQPQSSNQLFWCLVNSAPHVRVQEADILVKKEGVEKALQRPNPSLDVEIVDEKGIGTQTEAALLHTFELGGKRNSKKAIAQSQLEIAKTEYLGEMEAQAQKMAVKLYRLRQISTEIEITNENIKTFQIIQSQYRKIGRLSPEQSVSASVFEIAEEKAVLNRESLRQEKQKIESEIHGILGNDLKLTKELLPPVKKDWPTVTIEKLLGASRQILSDKVDLSKSDLSLAQSESWPDLAIGPKLTHSSGAVNDTSFGVALSMSLPLFNVNGGGRQMAMSELKKAELREDLESLRLKQEAEYLVKTYQSSSAVVTKTLSKTNIEKRHLSLHRLLRRGIVNPALVIELHKEVFEFYERLHEQELKAVDSLWRIYSLRGSLKGESL